jgi:hypothetical protein
MAQQNGGGNIGATEELIAAGANQEASSLDGFGQATPKTPFSEHPELLIGAAFLGGVLLAGLVSRIGR